MSKYTFVCPECGDQTLEQLMVNVTVETVVTLGDDDRFKWGQQTNSGDIDIIGFVCGNGHFLKALDGRNIIDDDDLITWFGSQ